MSDENKRIYTYYWVRADMADIMDYKKVKKQVGSKEIVKKKGFFGSETYTLNVPIYEEVEEWVSTGKKSDKKIDVAGFSTKIMDACNELHASGYDVIQIIPTIGGKYDYNFKTGFLSNNNPYSYGYGYGYSVSDCVIIIGKLRGC